MGDTNNRIDKSLVEAGDRAAAAHLRAERARLKLKQTDLSLRTGISVNTISRLETGERKLTLSQLFAICAALGISPGDFLDDAQAAMRE